MIRIFIYITFFAFSYAGTDGTIRGQVLDVNGDPVIGAQIIIEKIGKGTATDIEGNYLLLNVNVGDYDLACKMIGYQTQIVEDISVVMDQTQWLNFTLSEAMIEGETVYVSGEKPLVEKGSTSKKVTVGKEAIKSLPIRDVTELYNLQSGVVKVESKSKGVPNSEERGLQEVHVRGGRTGEIAYMIDGMYVRNPIYGGIGNGTRLNKFAIQEFDWQPGGFNAEYGDAMSAVSNWHTMTGSENFVYKLQYETSLLGEALGSEYDRLRDYNDYNFGFGWSLPFYDKIKFWISGQSTTKGAYKVYKFDNKVYDSVSGTPQEIKYLYQLVDLYDTPVWDEIKYSYTFPWDNTAGYRPFGFDRTDDYFAKITYDITNQHKINLSYWKVDAHRKNFGYSRFLYWDEGQNELLRETERFAIEFNHTINTTSFYTLRMSKFVQDQFIGVRWQDSDNDGYPDWYEWSHQAGYSDYSDPKNPNIIPFKFSNNGQIVYYDKADGRGPSEFTSGWYYGAEPGNYNWAVAESFTDLNQNGVCDYCDDVTHPLSEFSLDDDANNDGEWNGPVMVKAAPYREGSYWLTPEMYVDYENFEDAEGAYLNYEGLASSMTLFPQGNFLSYWDSEDNQGLNLEPLFFRFWFEGKVYGGSDRFYSTSNAETNELRFDFTKQFTDKWRSRFGFDYKFHQLNYYEVENPWDDASAFRQRFAEQWDDFGVDNEEWINADCNQPDFGEGNGSWDGPGNYENPCTGEISFYPGEVFDDFNGDGGWNDYVEPQEFATYWQNTFEVPWMIINAGVRLDAVNYKTKIWADTLGNFSPYAPYFYFDCGIDQLCEGDEGYVEPDPDGSEGNRSWDKGEATTGNISDADRNARVIFKKSDWLYKISPRFGISHVISDGATFTFNYGLYYQTPVYEYIYRNVNKLEDPGQTFEDAGRENSQIGNATMTAGRTESYEIAFNAQMSRQWAFSAGVWVKNMSQLTTARQFNSGVYEYKVAQNGDFGTAIGFDFTVEIRHDYFTSMIQYTYSTAKSSSEYDEAAFGEVPVDAPKAEFLMPYDRTHDLTISLFTNKIPGDINMGLTGFYQSGYPYTPLIFNGDKPQADLKNENSKRAPALLSFDLSISKDFKFDKHTLTFGANIFNIFDEPYSIDIYELTGTADSPGEYYDDFVGKEVSGSYYDRPWMYSNNREINFFIRVEFE